MLNGHLHVLFEEMSIRILCVLTEFFLLLSCKSPLYTLDTSPLLLGIYFAHTKMGEHVDSIPTGTRISAARSLK